MEHHLLTVIVLIAAAGVAAQWAAWLLGLPAIVLLLGTGILLGPVTGLLRPEADFGAILHPAISAAVAIVILEESLNLDFAQVRTARQGVVRMAAIGVPLSWALGAAAAVSIAGLSWPVALLLGALLVITGPTVIQPLMREIKLARRPAAFLQWEGMLNEAAGAVLAVLTLEFLLALEHRRELHEPALDAVADLALGAAIGAVLGVAAAFLMRFLFLRGYAPAHLKAPLVLAAALLIYGLADAVQRESGLIGIAAFGIGLANLRLPEIEDLRQFKGRLSVFLVSGLFIVIAATLPPERIAHFGLPELAFVGAVLLVVRPAAMLVATAGTDMSWQERLFVAVIAPRGIVAAALAGLAAARLAGSGYEDGTMILPLVFLAIAATVALHGFLAAPLARALGLAAPVRPGLILVGGNPWTVALAEALRQAGTPVLLSDRSEDALDAARKAGLQTHEGHILAPGEDAPKQIEDHEVLLTATGDDSFNALVCLRFEPELGPEHVYQTAVAADAAPQLDRPWRGKILAGDEFTIGRLLERMEAGWSFAAEELKAADDPNEALRADPDGRIPVALVKASGGLVLASPETELVALDHGRLIVFAAPGEAPGKADRTFG